MAPGSRRMAKDRSVISEPPARVRSAACLRLESESPFGAIEGASKDFCRWRNSAFHSASCKHVRDGKLSYVYVLWEWTGARTSEILSVLRNSSGESAEYLRAIARLAEKIDGSSTGSVLLRDQTMEASTRLERLRSVSAEIRDGIDACLDEYGDRIV